MTKADWLAVLARIVPGEPIDLDRAPPSDDSLPAPEPAWPVAPTDAPPPATRLWHRRAPDGGSLGVRIGRPLPDPGAAALRLAEVALERGITPVILSTLDMSGFERFGFRVERLPGAPGARAAAEAELARFWDMSIIIDAEEIGLLR
jgi:hypothetical protein